MASPVLSFRWLRSAARYPSYFADLAAFRRKGGVARWFDLWPCLDDNTSSTRIDVHYFHQALWAARRIKASATAHHVDIGSDVQFVGMLTVLTTVSFYDIRPLVLEIPNYRGLAGSITELPLESDSVASLSSLHVIEHIGLGRYGDSLDPEGSVKAAAEISRVLAPNGRAYLSTPIGRSRTQFNGQRVFGVGEFIDAFSALRLLEFSMVAADGRFLEMVDPSAANIGEAGVGSDSGLGLFVFTKDV